MILDYFSTIIYYFHDYFATWSKYSVTWGKYISCFGVFALWSHASRDADCAFESLLHEQERLSSGKGDGLHQLANLLSLQHLKGFPDAGPELARPWNEVQHMLATSDVVIVWLGKSELSMKTRALSGSGWQVADFAVQHQLPVLVVVEAELNRSNIYNSL